MIHKDEGRDDKGLDRREMNKTREMREGMREMREGMREMREEMRGEEEVEGE